MPSDNHGVEESQLMMKSLTLVSMVAVFPLALVISKPTIDRLLGFQTPWWSLGIVLGLIFAYLATAPSNRFTSQEADANE